MRRIILTGDDFGLAVPVNEAIVKAHRAGALTAASLMVTGAAAADAVERARSVPSLAVGLHLVLVEGKPALKPSEVPGLVDGRGAFLENLGVAGFRFFFQPGIRRQLEAEIREQFVAFGKTGLELDHVNAHNHMHLHPTVLGLVLRVGREFGMKAVRLPNEPPALAPGRAMRFFLAPWVSMMRKRLRRAGIRYNDYVFGISRSGAMSEAAVIRALSKLPDGTTEMYFHPATARCPETDRTMPGYDHRSEFLLLTGTEMKSALAGARAEIIAFRDLGETGSRRLRPGPSIQPGRG